MKQRDISYGELSVLAELFEYEVQGRKITFPNKEIREQALHDFICQYQDGNDEPHIELSYGATAEYKYDDVRWCSNCGKPMSEGYYLGGEFACCDECALALYNGDKKQMKEDLSHAFENDAECYYTEWDSFYFD